MLFQITNGTVMFSDHVILHDINFEIRNTEKIAVVGRNGCGKTTLLKLISGEVELEEIQTQIDSLETEIAADMEVWEALSSQLEELPQNFATSS